MWPTTSTVEGLTRPRVAVALVSAVAVVSVGYYAYIVSASIQPQTRSRSLSDRSNLHRSNAVRRSRRNRPDASLSDSSDEGPAEENATSNVDADGENGTTWAAEEEDGTLSEGDDELAANLTNNQRAGHNIVALLFRVSEDNARRNGCVHRGCQCNSCGMVPIRGIRYRCANCADFDLCETCETQGVHTKTHIFYKIRVPAPPFGPRQLQTVWYTGDPDTCRRMLPRALIPKLTKDTGFERPELEAFWEQWTFMANTEWLEDPDGLYIAMDRKTFERCLVPTGGSKHAAPNLIHDRMFAFYDLDRDGLIGFTEFLTGLSYRKRKDKLRKIFEGYDIDGDGFVSRKDFLRMFRAYYVLYKQMHRDILDGLEDQLLASGEAQQLIASRQPLSSLFGREGRVPSGDPNVSLNGKTLNSDGSAHVDDPDQGVVLGSRQDTAARQDILTSLFAYGTVRPRWRLETATVGQQETADQPSSSNTPGLTEADRPYLVALLEPPTTLEGLSDAVMGDHTLDIDEGYYPDEDPELEDSLNAVNATNNIEPQTESEAAMMRRNQNSARTQMSKRDKSRRDMARGRLHDRWKRRQFYLDEEEGGTPPNDWNDDEDIFISGKENHFGSRTPIRSRSRSRSRSSSESLFVDDDAENYETRSNSSVPSDSLPPPSHGRGRWSGFDVSEPERDAGKEILYQVTQQAFNELLDIIFKPAEDLAIKAQETKKLREFWKYAIDAIDLSDQEDESSKAQSTQEKPSSEKSLEELLQETGYQIVDPHAGPETNTPDDSSASNDESTNSPSQDDPTLPQFRPNSLPQAPTTTTTPPAHATTTCHTMPAAPNPPPLLPAPSKAQLQEWKRLTIREDQARERKGWGKLNFEEFEEIHRSQEYQGNRLDYLGSWIDFCIP